MIQPRTSPLKFAASAKSASQADAETTLAKTAEERAAAKKASEARAAAAAKKVATEKAAAYVYSNSKLERIFFY